MKNLNILNTILVAISLIWSGCTEKPDGITQEAAAFNQAEADSTLKMANDAFYAALNENFTGNTQPLIEVWSHSADVSDQGPFGARLDGWPSVEAEFL